MQKRAFLGMYAGSLLPTGMQHYGTNTQQTTLYSACRPTAIDADRLLADGRHETAISKQAPKNMQQAGKQTAGSR